MFQLAMGTGSPGTCLIAFDQPKEACREYPLSAANRIGQQPARSSSLGRWMVGRT